MILFNPIVHQVIVEEVINIFPVYIIFKLLNPEVTYVWFLNCVWINISLICLFDSFSNTIIGPFLRDVFTFVRIEDSVVSNLIHALGIAFLSLKDSIIQ